MALREATARKLSPVFEPLLNELNALPSVNFIAATSEVGILADHAAERMQRDYKMKNKFCGELMAGNGFSPEVTVWGFGQMTGIELTHQSQRKTTGIELTQQPLAQGMATDLPRTDKRMVEDSYKL